MKNASRFRGGKRIEVIEVAVLEGDGMGVAYREVTYYLHLDGTVLAWHDPLEERLLPWEFPPGKASQ